MIFTYPPFLLIAYIDARDKNNRSAIFYSMLTSNYENTKFLLDQGVDIKTKNSNQENPLLYDCKNPMYNSVCSEYESSFLKNQVKATADKKCLGY